MIRIDEIYNNTFWPWIEQHLPFTRLFFCDPPGRSDAESLRNFGKDTTELHYIFLHDQEPIHLDLHGPLFDAVVKRNLDLNHGRGPITQSIIVSELNSDPVDTISERYGWQVYYYFFHGWAAQDWYRGYDKSFLIADPFDRKIDKSFICPNRIIGGKRDHRILLMYHMLKENISNAYISFPAVCPVENIAVNEMAKRWHHHYPDMPLVFDAAGLPWHMPGENDHPMHSCWLSLFDQCARSMCYVVTETVYFGHRSHLTEKTFKPICLRMPFVLVSAAGSLEYLRSYGFQTFNDVWDESYDLETDDQIRMQKIATLLADLDGQSPRELQQIYRHTLPKIEHNFRHFYGTGFTGILWQEFTNMLRQMQNNRND